MWLYDKRINSIVNFPFISKHKIKDESFIQWMFSYCETSRMIISYHMEKESTNEKRASIYSLPVTIKRTLWRVERLGKRGYNSLELSSDRIWFIIQERRMWSEGQRPPYISHTHVVFCTRVRSYSLLYRVIFRYMQKNNFQFNKFYI